jgi:hypothetical protein
MHLRELSEICDAGIAKPPQVDARFVGKYKKVECATRLGGEAAKSSAKRKRRMMYRRATLKARIQEYARNHR